MLLQPRGTKTHSNGYEGIDHGSTPSMFIMSINTQIILLYINRLSQDFSLLNLLICTLHFPSVSPMCPLVASAPPSSSPLPSPAEGSAPLTALPLHLAVKFSPFSAFCNQTL